MIQNRIDKETLLRTLSLWNGYLKRKVHLIACGGTALTLMDLKESTKVVDLIIPSDKEYKYDDCLTLFRAKHKEIDYEKLKSRFYETSSYDISDDKHKRNFEDF